MPSFLPLLLAAITILAAACSPGPPSPAGPTPGSGTSAPVVSPIPANPAGVPPLSQEYTLSLATSGTAESYYGYGKALASVWSAGLKGVRVTPETAGASVGGIRSLGAKQVDMALAQSDIVDYAYNGTEMFKDKIANLRAIGVLYPQLVQWVVEADVIRSVGGMQGSPIAVGPAGSGSEANTREILDVGGIAYKDLEKALFLSSTEAVDAFKAREVDGFCLTDGVPSPAVTEAANSAKIALLPISGDLAQKVAARYKHFSPATIPAGSYTGITAPVPTLEVQAILVVRQDLDDGLVYWLTRTLIEKQPELAQADPLGKELSRASVAKDLPLPLHPGAERYYREIGLLK
jgi:uncharacterized protein